MVAVVSVEHLINTKKVSVHDLYSVYSINVDIHYEPIKPILARLSSITRPYLQAISQYHIIVEVVLDNGAEVTYSSNKRKNQTSKSSFLKAFFAQSLAASAIRTPCDLPSSSPAKYLTASRPSSPRRESGM